jgi:hypothetical protein
MYHATTYCICTLSVLLLGCMVDDGNTEDGMVSVRLVIDCQWGGFDDLERWHLNSLRGDPEALIKYVFTHSLVLSVGAEQHHEAPAEPCVPSAGDRGVHPAGGSAPKNSPAGPSAWDSDPDDAPFVPALSDEDTDGLCIRAAFEKGKGRP